MDHAVRVARDGGVLRLTLDRPDKKNALTSAMYRGLIAAFKVAQTDAEIGAILIEGSGGSFTAGNDIGDFIAHAGRSEPLAALDFVRVLAANEVPLVAAVEGVAIGIGTTLLFHCDLAYATPDAIFRMPFVDLGLVPEAAASLLVPARIGRARASELLLLCESFGADRARELGIVNAVVPPEALGTTALDKARALAAKPREALRLTRHLLNSDAHAIRERVEEEARLFAERLHSVEAQAVLASFLSRSKA